MFRPGLECVIVDLQGEVHAIYLLYFFGILQEAVGHEVLIERLVREVECIASAGEQGTLLELFINVVWQNAV